MTTSRVSEACKNTSVPKNNSVPGTGTEDPPLLERLKRARLLEQSKPEIVEPTPLKKKKDLPKKKRNDPTRAEPLFTDKAEQSRQRRRDEKKKEKKEKDEQAKIKNQESGGICYPPPVYSEGTERKKPNRNGITRTRKGLQAQIDNGKRVAENKAMFRGVLATSFDQKRPATSTLPAPEFTRNRKRPLDRFILPQTVFRSQPEESLEYFIRSQLLPDVDLKYAETAYPGNDSDDIAITWSGRMTYWTRDFDLRIKDVGEFQLQVKRTNLAKKLYWCLCGGKQSKSKHILLRYYPELFQKKRRAFCSLHKSLMDFALRLVCNQLALKHGNVDDEILRPLFHISAVSAKAWKGRSKVTDSSDLLDLLFFESKRFETYYWDFLKAVFPNEDKVIFRARKIFAEKHASLQADSLRIAIRFSECLEQAKSELNYDDSDYAIFKRWHSLEFEDIEHLLPDTFKRTTL